MVEFLDKKTAKTLSDCGLETEITIQVLFSSLNNVIQVKIPQHKRKTRVTYILSLLFGSV